MCIPNRWAGGSNPVTVTPSSPPIAPSLDANVPVLLHGGGIDSSAVFLLLATSKTPFTVLHVDYGQPTVNQERKAIREQCYLFGVPFDFATAPSTKKGREMFKGRNLMLISIGFTRSNTVYVGLIGDCVFADSSPEFLDSALAAARTFNKEAKLIAPTYNLHKGEELALIHLLGGKDFPFWTCNTQSETSCLERYGKGRWVSKMCSHCRDLWTWELNLKTVSKALERVPYEDNGASFQEDDASL